MISNIIDRILFTCGVLLFLQLPAFIDQYTHRLGGFQRGFEEQIASFQTIADNNFNGDLTILVKSFKQSNMPSVRETAETIEFNVTMNSNIQDDLTILHNETLTKKILYLFIHLRYELGKDTLNTFNPSVPLNLMAFIYGLFGGVLFSSIFYFLIRLPVQWFRNRKSKPESTVNV